MPPPSNGPADFNDGPTTDLNDAFPRTDSRVAACGHDLCVVGSAPPADCHPCVQTICQAHPECCTTRWSLACVDRVFTSCARLPVPPRASVCDFAVFAVAGVSLGDRAQVTGQVGAGGGFYLANDARISGDVVAIGNIYAGDRSTILGNAISGGSVSSGSGAAIGTRLPNTLDIPVPPIPTRTVSCGTGSVSTAPDADISVSPGALGAYNVNSRSTLRFTAAGTYSFASLRLGDDVKLEFPPTGDISIELCGSFSLGSRVLFNGMPGTDPLRLTWYTEQASLNLPPDVGFYGVVIAPNADVNIESRSPLRGLVFGRSVDVSPDSKFDSTGLTGAACKSRGIDGNPPPPPGGCPISLTIAGRPKALNEPCFSGLDCQMDHRCTNVKTETGCAHEKCTAGAALDASCDPCVKLVCDADPSCCSGSWSASCVDKVKSVCDAECGDGSGTCVKNAARYQDTSCSGVDLTVGAPCGDSVPVCNRGTVDAPAGLRLHFFDPEAGQMPSASPTTGVRLGTCTNWSPVPAGRCVSVNCDPALLNRDLVVMVNARGTVPECSRLDNWSVYKDGQSCASVCPNPPCDGDVRKTVKLERYEALCDTGKSGLWGFLRWRATTPGDSSVHFELRAAGTEAELATAPWIDAGTASTALGSAQCLGTGPLPYCPRDLYNTVLGASTARLPYLDLRITVDAGSSLVDPALDSWDLSYSCLDDE